jgi:hypothetical protein
MVNTVADTRAIASRVDERVHRLDRVVVGRPTTAGPPLRRCLGCANLTDGDVFFRRSGHPGWLAAQGDQVIPPSSMGPRGNTPRA